MTSSQAGYSLLSVVPCYYLALRQRLLKLANFIVRDFGVFKVQLRELGQSVQMLQASVGDFGLPEAQQS